MSGRRCTRCDGAGYLGPATGAHPNDYGRWCDACSGSGEMVDPLLRYQGHSHGNLNHLNVGTTRLDVGLDNHPDLRLFSLDEVLALLTVKTYDPVDHHRVDA